MNSNVKVVKVKFYKNGGYDGQEYTYLVPNVLENQFTIGDYAVVPSYYDKYAVVLVTDTFYIDSEELERATTINGKKITLKYILACLNKNVLESMNELNEV